jgi:hypothetical protein
VNDDNKEHTDHVLEECSKKVCRNMTSSWRIQVTNAYMKAQKVLVKDSKQHSTIFLTVD